MVKLLDYRFCKTDDEYDLSYDDGCSWSRIYEYKYITNFIENNIDDTIEIHNTSWGFEGIHIKFRDKLDTYGKCLHSDIVKSKYRNSYYYDITKDASDFNKKFDCVINISTIEHLTPEQQVSALNNLYKQVKVGGWLLLTFDYPRVSTDIIKSVFGFDFADNRNNILNGSNSIVRNDRYSDLNIIFLSIQKN